MLLFLLCFRIRCCYYFAFLGIIMNRFVSAVVDFGFECMFVAVCHFGTSYCFFSIIIITIIVIVIIVNGFIAKRK
jgi:hypothetical protein